MCASAVRLVIAEVTLRGRTNTKDWRRVSALEFLLEGVLPSLPVAPSLNSVRSESTKSPLNCWKQENTGYPSSFKQTHTKKRAERGKNTLVEKSFWTRLKFHSIPIIVIKHIHV